MIHPEAAVLSETLPPHHPDRADMAQEAARKPKLSMKVLQQHIRDLQEENRALAQRLLLLESRIVEEQLAKSEAAAAVESPPGSNGALGIHPESESGSRNSIHNDSNDTVSDAPQPILIPRSVRHPARKKTPFFVLLLGLFRFR
ncbi:hypothetical protein [Paenibacillus flagellatus]|uniref:Uncharacterized protein n=1 Tax=Paenibacillus flagellatus TaxID=2211139 RepID=A0A2V5K825_9BACL|nr:hypothetical protein [Paenibacillus flagellatus]PYI55508.1 hypothetical protein DLM86_07175 [Paenibacillus flagellatus]